MTGMRGKSQWGARGAALITALGLISFLLLLGLGFLTYVQRDLGFQRHQQAEARAQALARSGIEYYNYLDRQIPRTAPIYGAPGNPIVVTLSATEQFEIEALSDPNTYAVTGRILAEDGSVVTERRLVMPLGGYAKLYDDQR